MTDTTVDLPIHPTKRHPLTGQPLRALWVTPTGKVCWPIMGGAPDDDPAGGAAGGGGKGDGKSDGPGSGGAPAGGAPAGGTNATDEQGNDLGFPKDTPIAEMTDKQQASYWRNISRKHEGRVKDLVGDRKPEDVKKDLDAYQQLQREQQTPAEQALSAKFDEGRNAGVAAERQAAATAIFRGALEAGGIADSDIEELATGFNVAAFISDKGIETTKITNFAKRFTPGKGEQQERRRDFGGGKRSEGDKPRGSAGKAEAERRFKKTTASGS